jgi:hypothetical protein
MTLKALRIIRISGTRGVPVAGNWPEKESRLQNQN